MEVCVHGQSAKGYIGVFSSSGKNYDYEWMHKIPQNEGKGKVEYLELSKENQNNNIQSSRTILHVLRNWNLHTINERWWQRTKINSKFFIGFCSVTYYGTSGTEKRACLLSISRKKKKLFSNVIMHNARNRDYFSFILFSCTTKQSHNISKWIIYLM